MQGCLGVFGGVLGEYLGSKTDQKTTKSLPKTYPKLSTNFLIETRKRVLPRDSHYFLLAPIKGGIWASSGPIWGSVWKVFGE